MAKRQYVALIGDIVGSRQLKNRKKVQEVLESCLSAINLTFKKQIKSNFVITIGDEFQGLVIRDFPLHEFLLFFQDKVDASFQTRFGIGLGTLSTKLKKEALGMDGLCFHNAREAIGIAKRQAKTLAFQGFELNNVLSSLYDLVYAIEKSWTKRQAEIIQLYLNNYDQVQIAEQLNVSKQSISKAINSSQFEVVQNGWQSIQELFSLRINKRITLERSTKKG